MNDKLVEKTAGWLWLVLALTGCSAPSLARQVGVATRVEWQQGEKEPEVSDSQNE